MASARYGSPWIRHGDGTIYRGEQAESPATVTSSMPLREGAELRFYDSQGLLVGVVSSEWGRQDLLSARAEILPSGPGILTFDLAERPGWTVTHGTRVDLHLWGAALPVYSGTVQQFPSALTTSRPWSYQATGYASRLNWPVIKDETFQDKQIWEIVDALARGYVDPRTGGVVYAADQIDRAARYRVGDLRFKRIALKRALEQLAGMAGLYVWGVDERRRFFFLRESQEVLHHWWVGTHLASCDAEEDSSQVVNRIWIEMGKRLPLLGDQLLPDPLEDTESQALPGIGVREATMKAPSVFTESDAIRMASVELARKRLPTLRMKVAGIPFSGTPITCRGQARIVSQDGTTEETRPIKKVTYDVTGGRVRVSAELGDRALDLGRWYASWAGEQDRLEQLQQAAQRQTAIS